MSHIRRRFVSAAIAVAIAGGASAWAHEMTIKGTVAGLEPARIQVKTGEEKKGEPPAWYPIGAKTKILRGKKTVTFAEAKISVGERVVVTVDHANDGKITTLDIRLAEQ
jgi:hypothetical protein